MFENDFEQTLYAFMITITADPRRGSRAVWTLAVRGHLLMCMFVERFRSSSYNLCLMDISIYCNYILDANCSSSEPGSVDGGKQVARC